MVATADLSGMIKVWNTQSKKEIWSFECSDTEVSVKRHQYVVKSNLFSPWYGWKIFGSLPAFPSLRREVKSPCFYSPVFKTGRIMVYQCPSVRFTWPIHFRFHRVIGIDGLYGEISNFHSRVMGLYSSNCRWFFVCRAVNWEPLGQFTSNFA